MGQQQDEELRITARYVAEVRAGRQPLLSDYVARYPRYAAAIADFVAYFHAVEADLPQETSIPEPLSPIARQSLAGLDTSSALYEPEGIASRHIVSLLGGRGKRRRSPTQLAQSIGLSEDIISLLEQRALDARTIPHEVVLRLAHTLHSSRLAVHGYLASSPASGERFSSNSRQSHVAEERAAYQVEDQESGDPEIVPAKSFRHVLEDSPQLSLEQKAVWYTVLDREGL